MPKCKNNCQNQKIKEVLQVSPDFKEKGKFNVETATFALDDENFGRILKDYKEKNEEQKNDGENKNVNISIIDI